MTPTLAEYIEAGREAPAPAKQPGCASCQEKAAARQKFEAMVHAPARDSILLGVGFHAGDGTSTAKTSLSDKLLILRRCLESCDAADADRIVIVATGDAGAVRRVLPGRAVIGIGHALDRQQGESAIGRALLHEAEAAAAEWIVKVAGDVLHPAPGWARALVELAKARDADVVATAHHRPDWLNTQVYAVRPAFMRRTFPMPQDPGLERIGIEAIWGERIARLHLRGRWHAPEARRVCADGCENFAPADAALTYLHAHTLASAGKWPRVRARVAAAAPTVSIVIPAKNETGLGADGKPLLASTIESIAESSAGHPLPEVIVVDDASDRKLPIAYPPGMAVRVLRNPMSVGVDSSRNIGAAVASGDVIGIFDAHMALRTQSGQPQPGGIQKLAALAVEKNAIVVARCAHLEMVKGDNDYPLCGASFVRLRDPKSTLGIGWNHFNPPDVIRPIEALLGASYFFPRDIWRRLGGFVGSCRVWGYSEEGISLKAHFLGIPIWYRGDVTVSHQFRTNGPHPFSIDDFKKYSNRARVLRVVFSDRAFREVWLPRLKSYRWGPDWDAAVGDHQIVAEHAMFQAQKIRTDSEILQELFGVEWS